MALQGYMSDMHLLDSLCFGLPCHLIKFGHGVFLHSLFVKIKVLKPPMHL